jgi:hypothetical protein
MGMEFFIGFERKFGPVRAHVFFKNEGPEGAFTLFDTAGVEVDAERLTHTFMNSVPHAEDPLAEVGRVKNITMRMNTVEWSAKDASQREYPVDHIMAYASLTVVKHVHPVTLHSYSGGGKDYQIVTAPVSLGEAKGAMMFVKDDEAIHLIWQPAGDGSCTTRF